MEVPRTVADWIFLAVNGRIHISVGEMARLIGRSEPSVRNAICRGIWNVRYRREGRRLVTLTLDFVRAVEEGTIWNGAIRRGRPRKSTGPSIASSANSQKRLESHEPASEREASGNGTLSAKASAPPIVAPSRRPVSFLRTQQPPAQLHSQTAPGASRPDAQYALRRRQGNG